MRHHPINPSSLGAPKGFSHGIAAAPGRLLFVAGQIGADAQDQVIPGGFVTQFAKALDNVLEVVRAAGGEPGHICRLTMYATDRQAYLSDLAAVGAAYRQRMGRHFPAMALVEVSALVLDDAMIEIEATAVIPGGDDATHG